MKRLASAALISSLVFAPALALAQTETDVSVTSTVQASSTEPKPRPPLPKLGPAVKEVIKDSRDNIKAAASTTREIIKERVNTVGTLIDARKADIRALIEHKSAEGSSTMAMREEQRTQMRAEVAEKKVAVQDRIEAARAQAKQKFGENVQRSVNGITDRLTKAVNNLASIADRLDARIKEYEGAGTNMSVSIEVLAAARVDIATAQDKVVAVGTTLSAVLTAENPKEQMFSLREATKAAEDSLKDAKDSLHKVLESVRAESASSTTIN